VREKKIETWSEEAAKLDFETSWLEMKPHPSPQRRRGEIEGVLQERESPHGLFGIPLSPNPLSTRTDRRTSQMLRI
jgi:hypothetical protein